MHEGGSKRGPNRYVWSGTPSLAEQSAFVKDGECNESSHPYEYWCSRCNHCYVCAHEVLGDARGWICADGKYRPLIADFWETRLLD